jgi:hypothetical protein
VNDGKWDNGHCDSVSTWKEVVLDFGQVERNYASNNGSYYGYGANDWAGSSSELQDDTIVWLAEQYANAWYNNTSSCPRLDLELGLNNYRECQAFANCSTYQAGQAWADAVQQVNLWLHNHSPAEDWQITVNAADDIETQNQGWDCAGVAGSGGSLTKGFVSGFVNETSTHGAYKFLNYGNPFSSSGCWSAQDIHWVSWDAGPPNFPLPEIYYDYLACEWTVVGSCPIVDGDSGGPVPSSHQWGLEDSFAGGAMFFWGEMTECQGADPLPYPTCLVKQNSTTTTTDLSPGIAWQRLWNREQYCCPQAYMDYSTNIKFQGT